MASITAVLGAERCREDHAPAHRSPASPARRQARSSTPATTSRGFRSEKVVRCGVAHVPEGRERGAGADGRGEPAPRVALWRSDRADRTAGARARSTTCSHRSQQRRRRPAFTLSGGERQMLAIGRALIEPAARAAARRAVARAWRRLRRRSDHDVAARPQRADARSTVLLVEQNAAQRALSIAESSCRAEPGTSRVSSTMRSG